MAPAGEVELRMISRDTTRVLVRATAGLADAAVGEWTSVALPLRCLVAAGLDPVGVTAPLVLASDGALGMTVSTCGWEPRPKRCPAGHFPPRQGPADDQPKPPRDPLGGTSLLAALLAGCASGPILTGESPNQPQVAARGKQILQIDGLSFRDLEADGRLTPYEDCRLPDEARARDLVARMNVAEKIRTLMHSTLPGLSGELGAAQGFDLDALRPLATDRHVASFITRLSLGPKEPAVQNNAVQGLAEGTRLGISLTISADSRNHFRYVLGASSSANGKTPWPELLGFAAHPHQQPVRNAASAPLRRQPVQGRPTRFPQRRRGAGRAQAGGPTRARGAGDFLDRPAILTGVQDRANVIVANFGVSDAAVLASAFFIAYGIVSFPAAVLIRRMQSVREILLAMMVCGCLVMLVALVLLGLFILASGMTILQVTDNPLAAALGRTERSRFRLTLAQTFNRSGTFIGPSSVPC